MSVFLPTDDDSRADDGLRGHAIRVGVLLGLTTTAPKTFEESYFTHIEVVLVFVKNNQGIDCLRYPAVHGRNGCHTHVGRFHVMQEEDLQAGGQRGLTGTFLTEKIQDGEMTGALIDHVPEKGGYQVAESDAGVVAKDFRQLFHERAEKHAVAFSVHHQSLKLVDFRIVPVDFRGGGNVIGMVAVVLYDTHFIGFMKDAMLKDAVAEREELLALVPAELPDSLGRLGAGVEELLDVVEFVYLAQPYIIADRTYLLLEVGDGAHFGLLQLDDAAVAEGVEQPEEADTVILIMDMEQGFHPKVGKADGVFIILAQAIVTVVADKQVELPERIGLFLLLVHHGRLFGPLGLVAGLCHGILPQAGLSVDLTQLLDALFIYELVLYITKQVANVIDAVDFPEQRTGRGKLLLCLPDDEMLFLQVAVDFFA